MRRFAIELVLAALACGAAPAHASLGGPGLAQVLGWDAKAQRVYVQIVHVDDGEYTPTLWYFDLASASPAEPRLVEWSGGEEDDLYHERHRRVTRPLRPLRAEAPLESMLYSRLEEPAPWDSVPSDIGRRPRYLAQVSPGRGWDVRLRVLTLDDGRGAVRKIAQYALPGRRGWLAILSCEAMPVEEGYEIQFPVLIGAGPGTADPIDPLAFDVRR